MPLDFLHKNQRGQGNSSLGEVNPPQPNIIIGLYGAGVTISGTNQSLLVKTGTILLAQVIITEIITWSIDSLTITIITLDGDPLVLTFVNPTEKNIALGTLETAVNG
jgi:hypothetical protein